MLPKVGANEMTVQKSETPSTQASTESHNRDSLTPNRTDVLSSGQIAVLSCEPESLPAPLDLPPVNQIIEGEVAPFFEFENQYVRDSEQVEAVLLNRINTRFRNENIVRKLKGALAYKPIKALPPSVVARCVMERGLPHLGLLANVTGARATMCATQRRS